MLLGPLGQRYSHFNVLICPPLLLARPSEWSLRSSSERLDLGTVLVICNGNCTQSCFLLYCLVLLLKKGQLLVGYKYIYV